MKKSNKLEDDGFEGRLMDVQECSWSVDGINHGNFNIDMCSATRWKVNQFYSGAKERLRK